MLVSPAQEACTAWGTVITLGDAHFRTPFESVLLPTGEGAMTPLQKKLLREQIALQQALPASTLQERAAHSRGFLYFP